MTETTHILGASDTQPLIHPLYVRITHWINALAMLVMIGSGWQIYNASPLFPFTFPTSALGGWLAGGPLLPFAAMWVVLVNGSVYFTVAVATGHFGKLLPIRPGDVARDLAAALTGRLNRDVAHYNAVQKLVYAGILLTGVVIVLSGFAIWKPVQL